MTSRSQKALGGHLRRRVPSSAEEQVVLDRIWSDLRHEADAFAPPEPRLASYSSQRRLSAVASAKGTFG